MQALDASPNAPPLPAVPSPPKGMSSSSTSSRTSASQPMASQPPIGLCHGAPQKKGWPGTQGRTPGQVPHSLARAPSRELSPKSSQNSHLRRNQKPRLRLRQPPWALVSVGRGRKGTQTEEGVSKSPFMDAFIHSYNTHWCQLC